MEDPLLVTRVVLKNYKSIAACSVVLRSLTFLVGPNGAGKSNFLDALRFVAESLNTSLDHALRERGGINEVRRRSSGHPTHFGVRIEFQLNDLSSGYYAFRIGAKQQGGFEVQQEVCSIYSHDLKVHSHFEVMSGKLHKKSEEVMPPVLRDRLLLVSAAGLPAFRPLFDSLSHMGFYNLNPEEIRAMQPPDTGELLMRDGKNLASVLDLMARENAKAKRLVVEYLEKVVPGITGLDTKHVGKQETIEFRQRMGANRSPWRFLAENMSDGTLRALGVLTALFQSVNRERKSVRLIGIEEPEVALHPGAAGVLRDALRTAAEYAQVIVTSHSPDLLDDKEIPDHSIYPVINQNGDTLIGRLDVAGRELIKRRLYTAGELMRINQLSPDLSEIAKIRPNQLDLFHHN